MKNHRHPISKSIKTNLRTLSNCKLTRRGCVGAASNEVATTTLVRSKIQGFGHVRLGNPCAIGLAIKQLRRTFNRRIRDILPNAAHIRTLPLKKSFGATPDEGLRHPNWFPLSTESRKRMPSTFQASVLGPFKRPILGNIAVRQYNGGRTEGHRTPRGQS